MHWRHDEHRACECQLQIRLQQRAGLSDGRLSWGWLLGLIHGLILLLLKPEGKEEEKNKKMSFCRAFRELLGRNASETRNPRNKSMYNDPRCAAAFASVRLPPGNYVMSLK